MRVSNWLKRLTKCESGNVLFIGAATLPMIMGAAGLAIDTVQLALWKRQIQRAADSAALAGAHAMAANGLTDQAIANDLDEHIDFDLENNETPILTNTIVVPGSFANGTISDESCAVRGVSPCYGQAVQVTLQSERKLTFMSMFTKATNVIDARATAAVMNSGNFCMVSLYNGNAPGIIAGGNPTLDLECGIMTNARAAGNAVNIYGNATVIASPIAAVGGVASGKNSYSAQVLQPYSAAINDPFAHLGDPEKPDDCGTDLVFTPGVPLEDGACFANWDVKHGDHVQLDPGTYYVDNGTMDIKGKISGENVTIILLGDDSNLVQNGGGELDITAPTSGDYEDVAIYRERGAANQAGKQIKFNGGAELKVSGAIYTPSTDIWVGGNADFETTCLQVVGRIIEFKGGGRIRNECDGTGYEMVKQPVVRLVG